MAVISVIAIVLGGSNAVWAELEQARSLAPDAIIIGTNHAARDVDGRLDHWATMHGELLPAWMNDRAEAGRSPAGQLWTANHRLCSTPGVRRIASVGGSSGLLAVRVALTIGSARIMLCGVPMCQNGRHYDRTAKWQEARQYLSAWEAQLPRLTGKVRSFSGETARMLGVPDRAWLYGDGRSEEGNDAGAS